MERPELTTVLTAHNLTGVHPACDLFPMMTDDELAALVDSVRDTGFTSPVAITPDRILLDGRNRLLAGWIAGIDPPFETRDPSDALEWIVAENLRRRHLTITQQVMLHVDADELMARLRAQVTVGRPKKSASADADSKGKMASRLAGRIGVGSRTVERVLAAASEPDLADQMRAGQLEAEAANRLAKYRRKARPPVESDKPSKTKVILTLRTHDGTPVPYPQPQSPPTLQPTNEFVSWAHWTWNPVTGCLHGCRYCYAREIATKRRTGIDPFPVGFTPLFHTERLDAPLNTTRRDSDDPADGRVFVCSMADLFGKWVPQDWIDQVYDAMCAAPDWRYLTLTKFPQRYKRVGVPPFLWAGASVDEQRRVKHTAAAMHEVPAAVRWLSLEPLLSPLQFDDLSWCDWVVIGAQSATNQPDGRVGAFSPDFGWVVDIVAQAREAGCAVYLKPNLLGAVDDQSPGMVLPQETPSERGGLHDRV